MKLYKTIVYNERIRSKFIRNFVVLYLLKVFMLRYMVMALSRPKHVTCH